jgi:ABC-type Fe3+-hydroxamate transport system substrate-binding protein
MPFQFCDRMIHASRCTGMEIFRQVLPTSPVTDLHNDTARVSQMASKKGRPRAQRLQPISRSNGANPVIGFFSGSWRVCATVLAAVVLMLALTACDRKGDAPATRPATAATMRVVSLAPAITQMMADLGKSALLVGVSENDDAAPAGLPVVGNYVDINTEALLATKPTHVIMMAGKSGAPARLKEMAASGRFKLVAYPYPATVADVLTILADVPRGEQPSLGDVLACETQATAAASNMTRQLLAIRDLTKHQPIKPRVLIVIGVNPVMASGKNTVLNELLLTCSGENVASGERVSAPTFDREKLRALAPDVIVIVMPGAPPLKPIDEDSRLAELRGLDIPAVRNGRIVLISDQLALLPASNLGRIGGLMGKAVWPALSGEIENAMRNAGSSAAAAPPAETTQPTQATQPAGETGGR